MTLLALTHLSSRFHPRDIRKEAQQAFADTVVPRDFDQLEIPFAERGAPVFHHGGARERGANDGPVATDPPDTVTADPDL